MSSEVQCSTDETHYLAVRNESRKGDGTVDFMEEGSASGIVEEIWAKDPKYDAGGMRPRKGASQNGQLARVIRGGAHVPEGHVPRGSSAKTQQTRKRGDADQIEFQVHHELMATARAAKRAWCVFPKYILEGDGGGSLRRAVRAQSLAFLRRMVT